MLIDCEQCAMQETSACEDCVVTCLLGGGPVDLSDDTANAISNLADEGLVPHLRLIPAERRVSCQNSSLHLNLGVTLGRRGQGLCRFAGDWDGESPGRCVWGCFSR